MSYEELDEYMGDITYDYIEDTYLQADDLAEHAVPSPPAFDSDDEFDPDLWQFDYWMDIEYGSDGDEIRERRNFSRATKRKRAAEVKAKTPSKRRKVQRRPTGKMKPMDHLPNVMKIKNAIEGRYEPQDAKLVDIGTLKSWALIKDWRERFRNTPMWAKKRPTTKLVEVEDAEDDDGLDQTDTMRGLESLLDAAGKEVGDGEGDDGWEDEEEEGEDEPMALDPEALKMALQQNLAAAGISVKGMDEQTLMSFAMKMFAGESGADDVAGEFAEKLLGGKPTAEAGEEDDEDEGEDTETETGFSGWVAKQAEANASKKEAEAKSSKHELPTPASSHGRPSASPPDKQASKLRSVTNAASISNKLPEAPTTAGAKRKADDHDENARPKRAARRFDAPTAASKARSTTTRKGRKG